jgi:ParB/RepB/Spo0J family partition protein
MTGCHIRMESGEHMEAELRLLELDSIDDHPSNPRLVYRDDVIDAIASCMDGEYPQRYAVHVRPVGDRFQLISGHQRKRAAAQKGLTQIWAWVEDMTDDQAFMELVTSNNQGELSPLEIGLHALAAVPIAKGGRGKKGGLSEYAEKIGKDRANVTRYREAAEVFESLNPCINTQVYLDKAQHLAAIRKAPAETWGILADVLVEKQWNVADTEEIVAGVLKAAELIPAKWQKIFLDVPSVASAIAGGAKTVGAFERLATKAAEIRVFIEEKADKLPKDTMELFLAWLEKEKGGQSWEIAAMQKYHSDLLDIASPAGKYDLILADPPWKYDFAETDNRQIENQYPTMDIEELCALVPPAADNCVLFMWATAPKLREALTLMDAWGFEYKTHAIWDKQKIGMGYWFRGRHELLLVGTKGDVSPPEPAVRQPSVFSVPREEHSKKPDVIYEALEAMFPKLNVDSRCEMFNRNARQEWSSWGNAI